VRQPLLKDIGDLDSAREGDEVVQLYISGEPGENAPIRSLRGFQRIHLKPGESKQVTFKLESDALPKSTVVLCT
jgi:beta-glucosidase